MPDPPPGMELKAGMMLQLENGQVHGPPLLSRVGPRGRRWVGSHRTDGSHACRASNGAHASMLHIQVSAMSAGGRGRWQW
jgi:hypothetical protein